MDFFEEVPEETIIQAAAMIGGNFRKLVRIGNQYKEAGVQPIYMSNETGTKIKIVIRETYGKFLH